VQALAPARGVDRQQVGAFELVVRALDVALGRRERVEAP
jgi:hypothetical protein